MIGGGAGGFRAIVKPMPEPARMMRTTTPIMVQRSQFDDLGLDGAAGVIGGVGCGPSGVTGVVLEGPGPVLGIVFAAYIPGGY